MGASMGIMSYFASKNLHRKALGNVLYSPMSMFDTQPLGRLLGVFGKGWSEDRKDGGTETILQIVIQWTISWRTRSE